MALLTPFTFAWDRYEAGRRDVIKALARLASVMSRTKPAASVRTGENFRGFAASIFRPRFDGLAHIVDRLEHILDELTDQSALILDGSQVYNVRIAGDGAPFFAQIPLGGEALLLRTNGKISTGHDRVHLQMPTVLGEREFHAREISEHVMIAPENAPAKTLVRSLDAPDALRQLTGDGWRQGERHKSQGPARVMFRAFECEPFSDIEHSLIDQRSVPAHAFALTWNAQRAPTMAEHIDGNAATIADSRVASMALLAPNNSRVQNAEWLRLAFQLEVFENIIRDGVQTIERILGALRGIEVLRIAFRSGKG